MHIVGLTAVVLFVTAQFLQKLFKTEPKPSPEEALGKALGHYLESGIKVRIDSKTD